MRTPDQIWFEAYAAHSDSVLWLQDPVGTLTYLSPGFETLFGVPAEKVLGSVANFFAAVHPDDRAAVREAGERASRGEAVEAEYRIVRPDGEVRWISDKGFALFGDDGALRCIAGVARDITPAKQTQQALADSEAQARLLLAELQHRVRNTLGVVRSIARRTAEQSRDVEEFATHLDGRLAAFARVQALVTRRPDAGVSLREIVEDELLAHAAHEGRSVELDGPDLLLEHRTAERISLAVHELAVNAVKHGVLGCSEGKLEVRWSVDSGSAGQVLSFSWSETGLPRPLRKPRRSGFGTELLTRTLSYELKAKSAMHFGKDGFSYSLFVPLPPGD